MTKELTIDGNKLIAEFMGYAAQDGVFYYEYSRQWPYVTDDKNRQNKSRQIMFNELKYHSSWDWLMPVVENIEQAARVDIYGKACKISQPQLFPVDIAHINEHKITAVWICVVEFIQWLNTKGLNP